MISIIIPTYNEEEHIGATISLLKSTEHQHLLTEIIVVDGGSRDKTVSICQEEGIRTITSAIKGRSAQMNVGAQQARGDVLYFLHADTKPPTSFLADIQQAIQEGYSMGCFRLAFDHHHWFLRLNCWFTRFNFIYFRFGDQSLFVAKDVFIKAGGFKESLIMLEDQEIIHRLTRYGRFKVVNKAVITSACKYLQNGIYRTQGVYFLVYFLFKAGLSQKKLLQLYRKLIRQDKI